MGEIVTILSTEKIMSAPKFNTAAKFRKVKDFHPKFGVSERKFSDKNSFSTG